MSITARFAAYLRGAKTYMHYIYMHYTVFNRITLHRAPHVAWPMLVSEASSSW